MASHQPHPNNPNLATEWLRAFYLALQDRDRIDALRAAAAEGRLAEWTTLMTRTVVASCRAAGWPSAARGHKLAILPQAGQEYLGLDVMAFPAGTDAAGAEPTWAFPCAVFELENLSERAAYSLWKVLCVRASLRVVFAYRDTAEQARVLVRELRGQIIAGMTAPERAEIGGDVLVVAGNRGDGAVFPYGYFRIWRLNTNIGDFERIEPPDVPASTERTT